MRLMKIAGVVLIVLGFAVIAVAAVLNYTAQKKGGEMVQAYMDYAQHITTENITEQTSESEVSVTQESKPEIPDGLMGVITIDKINLSAPLTEGTDNKSIRYALGHFEDTALPGENGNFAVAGHRSYTFGEYFSRLDELTQGDKIKVLYGKATYTYTVTESFVVEPEQIEVLDDSGEPLITLVTCTPKWTATHRLIVRGILMEEEYE